MSQVPKTSDDLKEMVYHTDARVTAMEGQIATLATSQQRSEGKLDQLINALHEPKNVNWAAWAGVGLTTMMMLIGGSFGIVQYNALASAPVEQNVEYNRGRAEGFQEFQHQAHYEFGVLHNETKDLPQIRDRVMELEKQAAEARVSRRAIGDYAKEIGGKIQ